MSERIEEIKQSLAQISQWPWNAEGCEVWRRGTSGYSAFDEDPHIHICDTNNPKNTNFIAKAPEYISYLLKELEEAQEDNKRLQDAINWWDERDRIKTEKLAEAQQTIEVSKKLIEYDTAAMNKDEVTISKLKKIANDALGCMITMSAADNEHVQRIAGNLRALDGRE